MTLAAFKRGYIHGLSATMGYLYVQEAYARGPWNFIKRIALRDAKRRCAEEIKRRGGVEIMAETSEGELEWLEA